MMFSWLERHSKQTLQQEVRSTASPSLPKMKSTRTTSYISATVEPAFNQSMRDTEERAHETAQLFMVDFKKHVHLLSWHTFTHISTEYKSVRNPVSEAGSAIPQALCQAEITGMRAVSIFSSNSWQETKLSPFSKMSNFYFTTSRA